MIVLLGNSACVALLDGRVEITKEHGTLVKKGGRTYFITVHPAYAVRFTKGKEMLFSDFAALKNLIAPS
jgi:uracil-DNA glycosylase